MIASVLALVLTAAADPDPLALLARYDGVWRTRGERFETPASHPGHFVRTIANSCRRSGAFLSCAQSVDGRQTALVVYLWDPAAREVTTYAVSAAGGPAGRGRVVVAGDTITFPSELTVDGALLQVRVVNQFQGPDRIAYRREISRDGINWTVAETGEEERVGGASRRSPSP